MFSRYKEVWYGLAFGIGAVLIDIVMHGRMQGRDVAEEFASPDMLIYRIGFLAFGGTVGWMLWRHNRREREFRKMQDRVEQLAHQASATVTLTYAKLQMVLTRPDATCSPETMTILRSMAEELQRLRHVVEISRSD